ncbi:hypothetical protein D3C74_506290 [compost metagenome]
MIIIHRIYRDLRKNEWASGKAPLVGLLKLKGNSPADEVNVACFHSFAKYMYSELD